MMRAINYNDILDIIHSNVEFVNNVVKMVIESKVTNVDVKQLRNKARTNIMVVEGFLDYFTAMIETIQNSGLPGGIYEAHSQLDKFMDILNSLVSEGKMLKISELANQLAGELIILTSSLSNIAPNIQNDIKFNMKPRLFRIIINSCERIVSDLSELVLRMDMVKKSSVNASISNIRLLNNCVDELNIFMESTSKINNKKWLIGGVFLGIEIHNIGIVIDSLLGVVNNININIKKSSLVRSIMLIDLLNDFLTKLKSTTDLINEFGGLNMKIQKVLLKGRINTIKIFIVGILDIINEINNIQLTHKDIKNIDTFAKIIELLKVIMKDILKLSILVILITPLLPIVLILTPILIGGLLAITGIILLACSLVDNQVMKKMLGFIFNMNLILISIILLIPTILLLTNNILTFTKFLLCVPVLMLLFVSFILLTAAINLVSNVISGSNIVLSILKILLFTGMLLILTTAFIALASLSVIAMKTTPVLLLYLLFMIVLIGVFGLLGVVTALVTPLLLSFLIGVQMLLLSVGGILLIAAALLLISKIPFNKAIRKQIEYNIMSIMDTVFLVITSVFEAGYNITNKNKSAANDSWVMKFAKSIMGSSSLVLMAFAAAGILLPMVIATFSLLLITGILWLLAHIKFSDGDVDNIKSNISNIIDCAFNVITSIFDRDSSDTNNNPESRGWISKLITYSLDGLSSIIGAIMSVGFLALSIVSVGMVLLLAGELSLLKHVELDSNIISTKVDSVIKCAFSVIGAIFESNDDVKNKPSEKSWMKSALDWVSKSISNVFSGIKNVTGMLMSVGFLAMSVLAIGMVYVLAKQLTYISKIKFSSSDVINKLSIITNTSKQVIDTIVGEDISKSYINKLKTIENNTSKVVGVIRVLNELNKALIGLKDISDKNVDNNAKFTGTYVNLIEKINTIKIENVKTMANMFEKMSKFSESINGNFDELADALANKIAPLLAELRDIMTKMPTEFNTSIKSSSDTISRTIVNTSGNPANWTQDSIKRTSSIVGDSNEKEQVKAEQIRKAKEAKAEQERVSNILQDILDIMSGQGSHPEGVKTC